MLEDAPETVSGLLAMARSGDRTALDRLFTLCRNYVSLLAQAQIAHSMRSKLDASDLVQQTLLEAYQGFSAFKGGTEAEWLAWLRRIVNHNAIDFARQFAGTEKRQIRLEVDPGQAGGSSQSVGWLDVASAQESPSAQLLLRERELIMADAVAHLTPEYREVILLRNCQGLSFAEIAEKLGRSRPAVQMLWMRALKKLQEFLSEAPGVSNP